LAFTQVAHADLINFELTPNGETPVDNSVLDTPYSITGGRVRFFFDANRNNTFDEGDQHSRFEARGNQDASPQGFRSTKHGGSDRTTAASMQDWFLRQPDGIGMLPGPFIAEYDVAGPIDALSGQIWDIDAAGPNGARTEQWLVEVLDSADNLVASLNSPLGIAQADPTSLDSLPWVFSFNGLTEISTDVRKVRLTFTGTKTDGIGLAFDNFNATQAILPGDYNGNGLVEAGDYVVWRNHRNQEFNLPNEHPAAETTGIVDDEDYEFWKSEFGNSLELVPATSTRVSSVPEPSAAVLVVVAGWFMAFTRRKQIGERP
jgi:hypothetical protein